MRLDWFLPYLRKSGPGHPDRSGGLSGRMARAVLPASWFSRRETKQRGRVRRILRWLGPVCDSSPLRRAVQAGCFLLFLWQFLGVCWPYSATPAWQSTGWTPVTFDLAARHVEVVRDQPLEHTIAVGDMLFIRDDSPDAFPADEGSGPVPFVVQVATSDRLTLTATTSSDAASLELLSLTRGPVSLHQRDPAAWPSHYEDLTSLVPSTRKGHPAKVSGVAQYRPKLFSQLWHK